MKKRIILLIIVGLCSFLSVACAKEESENSIVMEEGLDYGRLIPYYGGVWRSAGGADVCYCMQGLMTEDEKIVTGADYTSIIPAKDSYGFPMWICKKDFRFSNSVMVCAQDGSWAHYFDDEEFDCWKVYVDEDHLLHVGSSVYKVGRKLILTEAPEQLSLHAVQDKKTGLYGYQLREGEWVTAPQFVEANDELVARDSMGNACILNEDGEVFYRRANGVFETDGFKAKNFIRFTGDDPQDSCWVSVYDGSSYPLDMQVSYDSDWNMLWKWENGTLTYVDGSSEMKELKLDVDKASFFGGNNWKELGAGPEYYSWENMIYAEKGEKKYLFDKEGRKVLQGDRIDQIRDGENQCRVYYTALDENQLKLYDWSGKFICDLEGAAVLGIYGDRVYSVSKTCGLPEEADDVEEAGIVTGMHLEDGTIFFKHYQEQ